MIYCLRLLAVLSLTVFSASSFAADQYAVTYERNVEVKMRDGVKLKADIFRPQAEGKFPVLLQRTPYNKDNGVDFGLKGAARGYVVIFEDVRGRYASRTPSASTRTGYSINGAMSEMFFSRLSGENG